MRRFLLSFMAVPLIAAAQAAPLPGKIGARNGAPEELFAGIGEGLSDAALARAVAEASVHPLGSLSNPVRVGGPEGARAYLARLRCSDNSAPQVGPRSDGGVGAYGSVVSRYTLDCGRGAPPPGEIMLDIYHQEHVETRAPAGFAITGS
jgi:hypothetical protein